MSILQVSEDRSASKRKIPSDTVVCTACYQRLDAYRLDWLKQHPLLNVLICKRCLMKHETPIQTGEDGMDEACRWCALEGDLICCDFCNNVFCNECIRRNLGRKHLNIILNAGPEQKWQCYVCNPDPIHALITLCQHTLLHADVTGVDDEEEEDEDVGEGVGEGGGGCEGVGEGEGGGEVSPKKRKYTKRQPKVIPPGQLTYEALVEKKNVVGVDEVMGGGEVVGVGEKVGVDGMVGVKEEGVSGGEEGDGGKGDKEVIVVAEVALPTTPTTQPPPTPSSDDILYIRTSDGKVVTMNRSDVTSVNPPLFKRPKGRPRLSGTATPSLQTPKKYPQPSDAHKNSPSTLEALADVKLHEKIPLMVNANAWNVVDKLTASIQSMCMLLSSLKDDLMRTEVLCSKGEGGGGGRSVALRRKRRELAGNFWRAYLAYKKSFVDIEAYSKSHHSAVTMETKVSGNDEGEENADKTNGYEVPPLEQNTTPLPQQPT